MIQDIENVINRTRFLWQTNEIKERDIGSLVIEQVQGRHVRQVVGRTMMLPVKDTGYLSALAIMRPRYHALVQVREDI